MSQPSQPASATVRFRLGTVKDAIPLSVFAHRVFEETFGPANDPRDMSMYMSSAFTPELQASELSDEQRLCVIGEDNGTMASYALLHVGASDPAVRGPRPIEIERFYVDAPWQGRGIAHAMMDFVIDLARAHAETLWLGVWCENARAIRFYEKRGFVDVGSHPFMLGTDLQTDRVMAAVARTETFMRRLRMSRLTVELEKRADGDVIFRCIRADGSVTWQRHSGARGVFFAFHDLTHLAVEGTLGLRNGFFGLIAAGWDIADTEGKSGRGPLSAETIAIENLVGLFDRERGGGTDWTADEFNAAARDYAAQRGGPAPASLVDDDIARTREAIRSLHAEWRGTPNGRVFRRTFE